jgi:hypothetical protein
MKRGPTVADLEQENKTLLGPSRALHGIEPATAEAVKGTSANVFISCHLYIRKNAG